MSWRKRVSDIRVGDQVRYSRDWLRSTGTFTGDLPAAKGVVTELKDLGGLTLARIEWDRPDVPERVNVKNLVKVKQVEIE